MATGCGESGPSANKLIHPWDPYLSPTGNILVDETS